MKRLLGAALAVVTWLVACGAGPALADEGARYIPASRSSRSAVLTRAEVVDIATETMGAARAGYVARIAWCESSFNTRADSNWPYVGLLQVDHRLHAWRVARVLGWAVSPAESVDYLKNPYVNLLVAVDILRDQGWSAWPYCSRYA